MVFDHQHPIKQQINNLKLKNNKLKTPVKLWQNFTTNKQHYITTLFTEVTLKYVATLYDYNFQKCENMNSK